MKRTLRPKKLRQWLAGTTDLGDLLGLSGVNRDEILFEANRLFELGDISSSRRLFQLAETLFPREYASRIGLGACDQAENKLVDAIAHFRAAIALEAGHVLGSLNLAGCLLTSGDKAGAREVLARVAPGSSRSKLRPELLARLEELELLAQKEVPVEANDGEAAHSANPPVVYAVEKALTEEEFRSVLERSTLAERRPMAELGTIAGMLEHADLIVTARVAGLLVGISRAITDYHFCTYLSDLAVDRAFQKHGIGRELIRQTHEAAGLKTTLILLAAPLARSYYPHIGMNAHDSCWFIPRTPTAE